MINPFKSAHITKLLDEKVARIWPSLLFRAANYGSMDLTIIISGSRSGRPEKADSERRQHGRGHWPVEAGSASVVWRVAPFVRRQGAVRSASSSPASRPRAAAPASMTMGLRI